MATTVTRTTHRLGRGDGLTSLEQRFLFRGPVSATDVADVLASAPMLGPDSVFGERPGEEIAGEEGSRVVRGFSPAPGFTFDVELTRRDPATFLVAFSQPERSTPYLSGGLLWTFEDAADGAVLHEHINTAQARGAGVRPLSGPGSSLRRWAFFRVGHAQVMAGATRNLAALLP